MSKSRRGKSASTNEISRWEQELIQAPFNEDHWKACVVFAAPNNVDDNVFIDILSDVVATGLRKLFSVITYDGLIKDAKEYGKAQTGGGKGKGAAAAKPPPFHEVCEQVKPLVDQGDPIPPSLMAKLLKFKLLHLKQKDLDRREEEKKAAKLAESGKKDEKGKKSRSPSGKRSKSPGKGKKGKKGEPDMPPSPKKDSKLKKRGDVEDTFKTIDDEPDDEGCPQHYIIIQGILMATVIQYLSDIGTSVDAIIRIKAETYNRAKVELEPEQAAVVQPSEEHEPDAEAVDKALREEEEAARRKEAENELQTFWNESDSIVLKAVSGHRLKDMAKYDVVVKDRTIPEGDLQELEGDKMIEFGTVIFEDVAVTCYNMLDHFLQYKSYLDSMKLLHVHTVPPSAPSGLQAPSLTDVQSSQNVAGAPQGVEVPPQVSVDPDKRYYKHLMEAVPPESQSVPIILHCLLEQVCATVDDNNPMDQEVPPREDGLNHLLASYITGKSGKLALMDDEKQSVLESTPNQKKAIPSSSPIMLHHGDELMSRAHHLTSLNGLDPKNAELKMLQFLPQNNLKDFPPPKGRETAERAARANELRHFCTPDVSPGVLDHALKQYAFEGMLLKVANEDGDIIDPVHLDEAFKSYSNPWDYPYTRLEEFRKVKFCSDESGKLKISSLDATGSPLTSFRNMDDWNFAEHLDQNTLLQVLQEAQFTLPYMDAYYHKRDHSLLLALHNPVGPLSRSTSSWQTKLHSNVGFRNYLEHVVTSINTWIDEQERVKREANRTPTPPPPVVEMPTPPLKVGSRYGLMTRSEMNAIKAEEEEKNKKGKGRKSASRSPKRSAKSRGDQSPDKKDKKQREGSGTSRPKSGRTPSAKGSQSLKSAASKDKRGRTRSRLSAQEDPEPETPSEDVPIEEHFDFVGYDVGDNLIHACGSQSTLFPCDGGQIRVEKTSFVQGPQNVRVSVYKDGNIFVLYFLEPIDKILTIEEIDGEKENEEQLERQAQDGEGAKEEGIEKSETEGTEKEAKEETIPPKPKGPKPFADFSSFVAQFSDGMTLSHSGYGPSGSLIDKEPKETDVLLIPGPVIPDAAPVHATPSPQPKAGSPKGRKKADEETKRLEELQQQQDDERARLEEEAKKRAEEERLKKPFQNLYITCPDGLHLEYFNHGAYESVGDKGGVAVRQSYPVRGGGKQDCEEARQKPAMEEQSRTVLTDGTIIKLMCEGGVQVLFPDGATSKCPVFPLKSKEPPSKPGSASGTKPAEQSSPAKKSMRPSASQKSVEEAPVPVISLPEKIAEWVGTGSDGRRMVTLPDGDVEGVEGVLSSVATCPDTGQVFRTREDNVVTVERPDGTLIVEHADGSRITTSYKQQQQQTQAPDNETGSQAQYCTVSGKFVKVECPGFATLVFESEAGSCETVFGNGVRMTTKADGELMMDRVDGSQLHLNTKGEVSFVPRELACHVDVASQEPADDTADAPAGVYVMRTNRQVCCELQDSTGAHFSVVSNGKMAVEKSDSKDTETQPEAQTVTNEGPTPASLENTVSVAPRTSLVPRYFIVHADGTGSELLRGCDVKDFLCQAEKDPSTALLRSPVEGHPGVTGITVMRPYSGGINKIWLRSKDEDTIIPRALRERDFKTLPAREEKQQGPKFGTNVGAGVNVGSVTKPESPPLITCPRALEFRQLIQYRPLTIIDRQRVVKAIENYSEYVEGREQQLNSILPQDPRNESEKLAAEQLEMKMEEKKQKEQQGTASASIDRPPPPTNDTTAVKDDLRETANQLADHIEGSVASKKYVDAITPDPVPSPPPPKWKRPEADWEKDRIELAAMEYGKHALRYKEVPNYFETAQGQAFLRQTYSNDMPDMQTLTAALADQARHPPPGEASIPDTPISDKATTDGKDKSGQQYNSPDIPQVVNPSPSVTASGGEMASPSAAVTGALSPNNLRPTNPTPAHAKDGGTPTPLRPTNPTPAHAAAKPSNQRPSNPTPKHALAEVAGTNSTDSPSPGESPQRRNNLASVQEVEVPATEQDDGMVVAHSADEEEDIMLDTPDDPKFGPRSLYIDASGEVRKDKVRLPKSILSSKPGALPNSQFMEIEDPVRRRVHTVSVAGGNKLNNGMMESLRGFELLPPQVSLGVLKEGCTYINTVLLKNVGIDSCRYKVKQPPPSTGLRVLYNPGPVAAGMSAKLDIEIFAVAVGVSGETGVGEVGHHVEIVTETDVLYLPVSATILTSFEYENRFGDMDSGISKGTTRVPNRPPSRDPTRPRKAEDYALISSEA